MTRYVIVGQGIAGVSAAEAIRSVDRSAEIFLVSNDLNGFYSRPGLRSNCLSIPRTIGAS